MYRASTEGWVYGVGYQKQYIGINVYNKAGDASKWHCTYAFVTSQTRYCSRCGARY